MKINRPQTIRKFLNQYYLTSHYFQFGIFLISFDIATLHMWSCVNKTVSSISSSNIVTYVTQIRADVCLMQKPENR